MVNRIGRYEIQAELGRGGFGQVFRAYDPTVGRLVAIKTLTAGGDPELFKRFRNEAAAAGKLRHNNIVIIYDFGEHEGSPFLVMELLDGEDLDRIISARRRLTLLQTLDIIGQSAAGLQHAHANGIVHRDIKPANIMLQRDGVVKIMDFGIALLTQATAARLTPKGSLIGTFPYMAPEQFHGAASDSLTDIFAFGVTCYKLLTGVHPFHAEEMGGMMYNIMNQAPAPIRFLSPECPEALEQSIFKMLAKDRGARYQNLEDVRFDLEPVIVELRKERVSDLIAEARALIAASQFEAANAMVRQAMDADPGNRTVRELRETLQRQIREHEVRPRIAALVSEGRGDLQARRFESALQKFHSALQLDKSNPELHALIAQAKEAQERSEQAGKLLARARQSAELGDLTAARSDALEALSADPQNASAEELRAEIEARVAAREKERRLQEGLSHAKRLMVLESFDQAIELLEGLTKENAGSTALRELLARARAEKEEESRRRRLHAATEEAKALLKSGSSAEAVKRLSAWRAEFPESVELKELASFAAEELRAAEQAEAVARTSREVRKLVEARRFSDATELVRRALAEYPGAPALRDLMQTVAAAQSNSERRAALDEAIRESGALNEEQRFREAVERIAAYVKAYGESGELEPLRRKAEEGLEKQRRLLAIRKIVADARAMLDEGRADSATQALEMGTLQFPDDSQLLRLYTEAQQQLGEQKQAEAISRIIAEAESLARARHFDRAIETLEKGLKEHRGAERLLRCREATLAGQARYRREQALRTVFEEVRALRGSGDLNTAIEKVNAALREFEDERGLAELKRQLEAEREGQERAAQVKTIADEAQTLLDHGQAISATEILKAAHERFPGENRLLELKKIAEARAADQQRSEAIARIVQEANSRCDSGSPEAALALLADGLRHYPGARELLDSRERAQKAKAERDRQQALEDLRSKARGLLDAGRLDEALDQAAAGLARFGKDQELAELQSRIEREVGARREEEAARRIAAQAEELLARDLPHDALSLLEGAAAHFRRPNIANLIDRAKARAAEQKTEQAVAESEREIRRYVAAGEFDRALEVLDRALKEHRQPERFAPLRKLVQSARERAELLASARRLHERGEVDSALETVQEGLGRFPDDREFQQLKITLDAAKAQRRRFEATETALRQASALLSGGQAKAAVQVLCEVMAEYPGDTRLASLLDAAEEQLRRAEREQDVARVRQQAEALIEQQNYEGAVALLSGRFPGEQQLRHLMARAQELLDEQHRRQAVEQLHARLAAMEQRVRTTRKSRLPKLAEEAHQAIAGVDADAESKAIVSRIDRQIADLLSQPDNSGKPHWKWIGGAAAFVATIAVAFLGPRLFRSSVVEKPPAPNTFHVEIRTDPPGASVLLEGRSCTPPDCRFELAPREYKVSARLKGFKPNESRIQVQSESVPGAVTLTLEPEPPPAPAAESGRGTLVLRAGVAGARVVIDGVPQGLTNSGGELRTLLEAGPHEVRIEKAGYRTPPDQRTTIVDQKTRTMTVPLTPNPAKLEIRGAPAGAEISIGRGTPKRSDGAAMLSIEVEPGDQMVRVNDGKSERQVPGRFEPGGTVIMSWRDIAPPKVQQPPPAKPPVAPTVTAEARESQDWNRVRASSDPEQLEAFIREHPGGGHVQEAEARLDEAIWTRTNQADTRAIQAYLSRFPRGIRAREAQRLLDDTAWNAVNKGNISALQAFINADPNGRRRQEAQAILDRLIRDRQDAEDRRKKVDAALAGERQAIRGALQRFNDAFVHKSARELKQIWPGALKDWLESMNQRGAYFVAALYPMSEPEISDKVATVRCDLITQTIVRGQPQPQNRKSVLVTLRRSGEEWLVEDPRGAQ
jgi:serine/threonine-protein kinase